MSTVDDYVQAVVHRSREPMEPVEFQPNWRDQPWRHKVYENVRRFPLPVDSPALLGGFSDGLYGQIPYGGRSFSLESLAAMLRHSYGLLARRLRVDGNHNHDGRAAYQHALWSRGTASGGGLYPCEVYWVSGSRGPMQPGVYHYSPPHHAMQRLLSGDVVERVRAAVPDHLEMSDTDQFLLVSVRFWKNAFKYASFCYHCVTMDLGCLLQTWQLWARADGMVFRPALWFDEPALNHLLGLDSLTESVMAVVPVPWDHAVDEPVGDEPAAPASSGAPDGETVKAAVNRATTERSRNVIQFTQVEEVHRATLAGNGPRPDPSSLASAAVNGPGYEASVRLPSPEVERLDVNLAGVLRARRSSFGLFARTPPLSDSDLGTILSVAGHGRHLHSDLRYADGTPRLTRLAMFANHVDGVTPGAYNYDPDHHALQPLPGEALSPFLQLHYSLNNYNLEQVAAVLAVVARPQAAIEGSGARSYRLVNAEVGAIAQTVYLAAATLGIGCGAALGFDNVAFAERLGIDDSDEWPLLLLMLGHERADQADVVDRLV